MKICPITKTIVQGLFQISSGTTENALGNVFQRLSPKWQNFSKAVQITSRAHKNGYLGITYSILFQSKRDPTNLQLIIKPSSETIFPNLKLRKN